MANHVKSSTRKTLEAIGELFITLGVILLLYVFWQLSINDPVVSETQQTKADNYTSTPTPGTDVTEEVKQFDDIRPNLKQGSVFAKVFIPRFGKAYSRLVGQGTLQKVTLNPIGVGHYRTSEWPGEIGNFAVAAHRTSHGAPFGKIDTLTTGDRVWVETNETWFTYEYRQTKIVKPTALGVITNVPKGLVGAIAGGKYMTMTSCHPKWSNDQRIVVWLELVGTQEASLGLPLDLVRAQTQQ